MCCPGGKYLLIRAKTQGYWDICLLSVESLFDLPGSDIPDTDHVIHRHRGKSQSIVAEVHRPCLIRISPSPLKRLRHPAAVHFPYADRMDSSPRTGCEET